MTAIIDRAGLDDLIGALRRRGFTVIGPTVRSQAIVYDEIASADDLPAGVEDVQDGGTYRLRARDDGALFAHTAGHDSRQALPVPAGDPGVARPPRRRTARSRSSRPRRRPATRSSASARATCTPWRSRTASSSATATSTPTTRPAARTRSSSPSTARGPAARASASRWTPARAVTAGHDLALTELIDEDGHRFLVEAGSERGREVLAELPARPAAADEPPPRRRADRRAPPPRWGAGSTRTASATCSRPTRSIRAGTTWPSAA